MRVETPAQGFTQEQHQEAKAISESFSNCDLSGVKEGVGRRVGEFPSTEHLGEPAMTWKLLDKYKAGGQKK